jgi:hypothetical protein
MLRCALLITCLILGMAAGAPAASVHYLTEYGGRIKVQRLERPVRHGALWNTHRLLLDDHEYLLNAADADYLRRCCQSIIDDVIKNHLYDAERGCIWDLGHKPPGPEARP